MTQFNPSSTQSDLDDDMPEYSFNGTGDRGRFTKTLRENGYSVTIRNEDATTSTRHVSPAEVIEQSRQREFLKQQSSKSHHGKPNPSLSASKAGGTAAIGQFLNHPLSSFIIAAIEDWQQTKQS